MRKDGSLPFVFLPAFAHQQGASRLAGSVSDWNHECDRTTWIWTACAPGRDGLVIQSGGSADGSQLHFMAVFSELCLSGYLSMLLGLSNGVRIALMPEVLIVYFGALFGPFFTSSGIAEVLGRLVAALILDHIGHVSWGIAFALLMGWAGFIALLPLRSPTDTLAKSWAVS